MKFNKSARKAALKLGLRLEQAEATYQGWFESREHFALDMAESMGHDLNAWPLCTVDWEEAGQELMVDYREHGGHYFRR
jgi:hypothetical protein